MYSLFFVYVFFAELRGQSSSVKEYQRLVLA